MHPMATTMEMETMRTQIWRNQVATVLLKQTLQLEMPPLLSSVKPR
jgi:hypothetical protein